MVEGLGMCDHKVCLLLDGVEGLVVFPSLLDRSPGRIPGNMSPPKTGLKFPARCASDPALLPLRLG